MEPRKKIAKYNAYTARARCAHKALLFLYYGTRTLRQHLRDPRRVTRNWRWKGNVATHQKEVWCRLRVCPDLRGELAPPELGFSWVRPKALTGHRACSGHLHPCGFSPALRNRCDTVCSPQL